MLQSFRYQSDADYFLPLPFSAPSAPVAAAVGMEPKALAVDSAVPSLHVKVLAASVENGKPEDNTTLFVSTEENNCLNVNETAFSSKCPRTGGNCKRR